MNAMLELLLDRDSLIQEGPLRLSKIVLADRKDDRPIVLNFFEISDQEKSRFSVLPIGQNFFIECGRGLDSGNLSKISAEKSIHSRKTGRSQLIQGWHPATTPLH